MELQQRIEIFLKRSGMPPTRFGHEVVNDRSLVFDLRAGRELRPQTARRIGDWLDAAEALQR